MPDQPHPQATPPLLPAAGLAHRLGDPALRLVDCRHDLARPDWGGQAWAQAHIPGAAFAHLDRDLAGPVTSSSGRHPLPDRQRFAAFLGGLGIGPGTHVVAYDQGRSACAARLWWLLRWMGHERVSVLDGGLPAWQAAGLPMEGSWTPPPATGFVIRQPLEGTISTAELESALAGDAVLLVDARSADRFEGRNETLDPVAGHVPGAHCRPFTENFAPDGRLLPAAELAQRWRATLAGRDPRSVVFMCGSGITACMDLLAMHVAGLGGSRLYGGSWSEWIRDPARPVATGPA